MKCWEISDNIIILRFCQANCTMPPKVALFFRLSSCVIAAVLLSIFQFRIANAMQCYWQFQFQSFTISNYQTLPLTIGHMKQIHFHSFMAMGPSSRPTFRSFCMLLQLAFHAVVPTLLKTHCNFIETIERFTAYGHNHIHLTVRLGFITQHLWLGDFGKCNRGLCARTLRLRYPNKDWVYQCQDLFEITELSFRKIYIRTKSYQKCP